MAELTQSEFCRLARGVAPDATGEQAEFMLGMRSSAAAACRDVHKTSAAQARSRLNRTCARSLYEGGTPADYARKLLACLSRYIELDKRGVPAAMLPGRGLPITFGAGNVVKARPDAIFGPDEAGAYEARVWLFDDIPLARSAAELIALPAVEYVSAQLGISNVEVLVWQLALQQEEAVTAPQAQARRADVETLLASV